MGNVSALNVLVHACCGPCSLMPVVKLREEGALVTLFFFNPNIHPQEEYGLRREALARAAHMLGIPVLWEDEVPDAGKSLDEAPYKVDPEAWVGRLNGDTQEGPRCVFCYRDRLIPAARVAAKHGFDAFTTSLLYSRYQQHERIIAEAEHAESVAGCRFLYRDFRPWWQAGIDMSREWGLYRQKWCGCILSRDEAERQRARRKAEKVLAKERKAADAGKGLTGIHK